MRKMISKIKKQGKNFSKYLFIGSLWTILNIFFMWFFIDVLSFSTLVGSTIVVVILFLSKFYAYRVIGYIAGDFLKYSYVSIGFALANIFFMWLFVDKVGISTIISSAIISYGLFILRFIAFDIAGLVKK